MTTAPRDAPLPIRHLSETRCYAPDCDQIAEIAEAYCWQHVGADDWVERLRRGERTTAEAGRETLMPGMRVQIAVGRFAGAPGRLIAAGPERAAVDLGVAIDGGNGVIVVPVSTVQGFEQ
ncbi:hypothetical protein GCM10028784_06620 [Myceligenerans cantabricum]